MLLWVAFGSVNNFKIKLCENFIKRTCTFGDWCHFAHGNNGYVNGALFSSKSGKEKHKEGDSFSRTRLSHKPKRTLMQKGGGHGRRKQKGLVGSLRNETKRIRFEGEG